MRKGCPGQGADQGRDPDGQGHFLSAVSTSHLRAPTRPSADGHSPADERSHHGRPGDAAGNNIPLYGGTTVCLSIHLLNDILVASQFWNHG